MALTENHTVLAVVDSGEQQGRSYWIITGFVFSAKTSIFQEWTKTNTNTKHLPAHSALPCYRCKLALLAQTYTSFDRFGEATRQLSRTHSRPQRKVNEIRSALLNAAAAAKKNLFSAHTQTAPFQDVLFSMSLCSACSALERNWRNSLLTSWWALGAFHYKSETPP